MTEQDLIAATDDPITTADLVADFESIGLSAGDTVIVHTSLSAIGWVCGGAPAVVDALLETVTKDGTVVMPANSGDYSDPRHWGKPPVPEAWWETIRDSLPPYRPASTPTRGMGAVAECFRTYPDTVRSRHPNHSFSAWGADAEEIVADHPYAYCLGDGSPLESIYERDGKVLLIGVSHKRNTSVHLAEYRSDCEKEQIVDGGPVIEDGTRVWKEYEDINRSTANFVAVGEAFERSHPELVQTGTVGEAEATLVSQPGIVDFAKPWFDEHGV